jgi:phage tail sheath protein FI
MPEYLSPGVYIEEIPSGATPIQGVGTSTAGFLGRAERGPESPRLVLSWLDYQRTYGGYPDDSTPNSFLPYAVQGFFDNGGQRCFVTRLVSPAARTLGPLSLTIGSSLEFFAIGRGAWASNIAIRIRPGTKSSATNPVFRISIIYYKTFPPIATFLDPLDPTIPPGPNKVPPDVAEDYDNLSVSPGATNNVIAVINGASNLVRITWVNNTPAPLPTTQFVGGRFPTADPAIDQNAPDLNAYIGDTASIYQPATLFPNEPVGWGLAALAAVDEVAILVAPDQAVVDSPTSTVLAQTLIHHCESLRSRFAVLSVPARQNVTLVPNILPPVDSTFGAVYHPWIQVFDPSRNQPILVPPSGHVAGIYAQTDNDRGVHKAPANVVVADALDLEFPVPKGFQDSLNPVGVNCIRDFRHSGRGIRVWGARTMSSDPDWRYVNVRRLFIYVEQSIDYGTQWVVFEPNDDTLWAKVRRSLTNFLARVWKSGALMGLTEAEAFFVKCDRTTMTQDDIDNGRLICYIGIAPVKPAEFVIFRISQKTMDAAQQ